MTTTERRRVGKYKLLNEAEYTTLSAYQDPQRPGDATAKVVDCYYCGTVLRPRRSTSGGSNADRLPAVFTDHVFSGECEGVEVAR